MHSTQAKLFLLLLFICLHSGAGLIDLISVPTEKDTGKGEKLQIEGTVRNVDEWKLAAQHERGHLFNSYWARLNWGSRSSAEWPRRPSQVQLDRKQNNFRMADNYEEHEPVGRTGEADLVNPEAELIDPGKASEQLANIKFMRYEKEQQIKKDI